MSTDPVELIVGIALAAAGQSFRVDDPLDFECEGFAVECKQFWSDRLKRQIEHRDDVIVVQGVTAAKAFAVLINPELAD